MEVAVYHCEFLETNSASAALTELPGGIHNHLGCHRRRLRAAKLSSYHSLAERRREGFRGVETDARHQRGRQEARKICLGWGETRAQGLSATAFCPLPALQSAQPVVSVLLPGDRGYTWLWSHYNAVADSSALGECKYYQTSSTSVTNCSKFPVCDPLDVAACDVDFGEISRPLHSHHHLDGYLRTRQCHRHGYH
jgi:hypothetical protein